MVPTRKMACVFIYSSTYSSSIVKLLFFNDPYGKLIGSIQCQAFYNYIYKRELIFLLHFLNFYCWHRGKLGLSLLILWIQILLSGLLLLILSCIFPEKSLISFINVLQFSAYKSFTSWSGLFLSFFVFFLMQF